jgi:hypothetical protein
MQGGRYDAQGGRGDMDAPPVCGCGVEHPMR